MLSRFSCSHIGVDDRDLDRLDFGLSLRLFDGLADCVSEVLFNIGRYVDLDELLLFGGILYAALSEYLRSSVGVLDGNRPVDSGLDV